MKGYQTYVEMLVYYKRWSQRQPDSDCFALVVLREGPEGVQNVAGMRVGERESQGSVPYDLRETQ